MLSLCYKLCYKAKEVLEMPENGRMVYCPVRLPASMHEQLVTLAGAHGTTVSDEIRRMIKEGVGLESNKESLDMIASTIRAELKIQLDKQIERIVKMEMKIGKLSAAEYYLLLKLLLSLGATNSKTLKDLATEARKTGIKYMQMRDYDVNGYLEDEDLIIFDAERL
jgi:hypothetical protein